MEAEQTEMASLAEVLAMQEAALSALKAARAADTGGGSAALEEALREIPRFEEETKRIRAQMQQIDARMARMNERVKKLEAKRRSELELEQKREASLKPKE